MIMKIRKRLQDERKVFSFKVKLALGQYWTPQRHDVIIWSFPNGKLYQIHIESQPSWYLMRHSVKKKHQVSYRWADPWLTFSFNLKHTDGVLWREVSELASRECVSSLSQRVNHSDRCLQKEGLEDWWGTDLLCHDASIIQNRRFWLFEDSFIYIFLFQPFQYKLNTDTINDAVKVSQTLPTQCSVFSVCPTALTVM